VPPEWRRVDARTGCPVRKKIFPRNSTTLQSNTVELGWDDRIGERPSTLFLSRVIIGLCKGNTVESSINSR
jgi:hypothetical protein